MVTWERDQLISYMNSAIRMVCVYRPDAHAVVDSIQLVAGTRQSLPAGAQRLHDAFHNGTQEAPGHALRIVERKAKDSMDPGWYAEAPAEETFEIVTDEKFPSLFWVSPPVIVEETQVVDDEPVVVALDRYVTLGWSTLPEALDVMGHTDQVFPLVEKYQPAVEEWMLYQAFARDSERTPNGMRAIDHRNAFFQILGVKTKVDGAYSPDMMRANANG